MLYMTLLLFLLIRENPHNKQKNNNINCSCHTYSQLTAQFSFPVNSVKSFRRNILSIIDAQCKIQYVTIVPKFQFYAAALEVSNTKVSYLLNPRRRGRVGKIGVRWEASWNLLGIQINHDGLALVLCLVSWNAINHLNLYFFNVIKWLGWSPKGIWRNICIQAFQQNNHYGVAFSF